LPRFIQNPEEYGFPHDLVAIGGTLDVPTLVDSYQNGVFPWPESDDLPILWFCPDPRGILRFEHLHVSRSLRRTLNKRVYEIRFDTAFEKVIGSCRSSVRKKQSGTWITPRMESAYIELHREGIAHSVEAYTDNHLVGGVYGVYLNNVFSGESMFHLRPDASKVALVTLLRTLSRAGVPWIDTQMITPVVESLGGELLPRNEYFQLVAMNRQQPIIQWSDIQKVLL
jgi:leucyl/phenylalanyl-tRNA---protein transferase